MADGFQVVAIRTNHKGAEVIGVIDLADAGRSIVLPAGRHRRCVKGPDLVAIVGNESNMHGALNLAIGSEPKFRFVGLSKSRISTYFNHQFYSQGRECTREKLFALLVIANNQSDVINDHGSSDAVFCLV